RVEALVPLDHGLARNELNYRSRRIHGARRRIGGGHRGLEIVPEIVHVEVAHRRHLRDASKRLRVDLVIRTAPVAGRKEQRDGARQRGDRCSEDRATHHGPGDVHSRSPRQFGSNASFQSLITNDFTSPSRMNGSSLEKASASARVLKMAMFPPSENGPIPTTTPRAMNLSTTALWRG